MFMIRTALVLGLAVLVLPTDPDSQARVFAKAQAATTWTMTFCDRNPGTCQTGREGWTVFVKKAEFGAKMAYELISERNRPSAPPDPAQIQRPGNDARRTATTQAPLPRGPAPKTGG